MPLNVMSDWPATRIVLRTPDPSAPIVLSVPATVVLVSIADVLASGFDWLLPAASINRYIRVKRIPFAAVSGHTKKALVDE
jgi:hypothetical protein